MRGVGTRVDPGWNESSSAHDSDLYHVTGHIAKLIERHIASGTLKGRPRAPDLGESGADPGPISANPAEDGRQQPNRVVTCRGALVG